MINSSARPTEQLFAERGWTATKFEDIASAANVSVATAYNHFNSKHVLIAEIFGRLLQPRLDAAERTLHTDNPIMERLVAHIRDLVALFKDESALTVPFVYAVHDYTTRAGGPPDPADRQDPRNLAPVPAMLIKLVDAGQRTNVLRPYPTQTAGPHLGRRPRYQADYLWQRSPLSRADQIRIPILVVQGANDPRVPTAEAEQLLVPLHRNGVPHEYLPCEDGCHGPAKARTVASLARTGALLAVRPPRRWLARSWLSHSVASRRPCRAGPLGGVTT